MIDLADRLSNFCTDFLALEHNEWFLTRLFQEEKGHWLNILEEFKLAKKSLPDLLVKRNELCVIWLDDPINDPGVVFVLFYDAEIGWNLVASYNRIRLRNNSCA